MGPPLTVPTLFKLLVGSGAFTSAIRAKLRNVRQTATLVASLVTVAFVAVIVGAACLAAAAYLALRPLMADYQAALLVGGGFIGLAGALMLVAVLRIKGGSAAPAPTPTRARTDSGAIASGDGIETDPLVHLISSAVQSPVVMTALALGIVAGRASNRRKRD